MSITLQKMTYAVKNLTTDELMVYGTKTFCKKCAEILGAVAECAVVKVKVTGVCDNADVTEIEVV